MKTRDDLKILYMQLRKDEETCDEEYASFQKLTNLKAEQIDVWNVFANTECPYTDLDAYDALVAGGSSDDPKDQPYLDPEEFPWIIHAKNVVRYFYDNNTPGFMACMGFLVALDSLDAEVIVDEENMEQGSTNVHLTREGEHDVLLRDAPEFFPVISFHKKRAHGVPSGMVKLAYSEKCPVHMLRKKDAPFYISQFHPEMERAGLVVILDRYIQRYFNDEKSAAILQKVKDECPEVVESSKLLGKFVDRILLAKRS